MYVYCSNKLAIGCCMQNQFPASMFILSYLKLDFNTDLFIHPINWICLPATKNYSKKFICWITCIVTLTLDLLTPYAIPVQTFIQNPSNSDLDICPFNSICNSTKGYPFHVTTFIQIQTEVIWKLQRFQNFLF